MIFFRTNNGGEFCNAYFQKFFALKGWCIHQKSCPYTPKENGVNERKHRNLLEIRRALMMQNKLKVFWGESILTATYIINRLPSPVLKGKSSIELLFGQVPSISHLKVFGCFCFASTCHIREIR